MVPLIKRDDTLDPAYFALRAPKGGTPGDLAEILRRIIHLEECCGEVQPELQELANAIDILNGTDEGSVDKTVKDAIEDLVNNAPEALDTLGEVAEWVENNSSNIQLILNQLQNIKTISTEEIDILF